MSVVLRDGDNKLRVTGLFNYGFVPDGVFSGAGVGAGGRGGVILRCSHRWSRSTLFSDDHLQEDDASSRL